MEAWVALCGDAKRYGRDDEDDVSAEPRILGLDLTSWSLFRRATKFAVYIHGELDWQMKSEHNAEERLVSTG